jgi:hypothetical protein
MNRYIVVKPNKKSIFWKVFEVTPDGSKEFIVDLFTEREADDFAHDMTMAARWDDAHRIVGCEFD